MGDVLDPSFFIEYSFYLFFWHRCIQFFMNGGPVKTKTKSSFKNDVVAQIASTFFFSAFVQCTIWNIFGVAYAIRKGSLIAFLLPLCLSIFYIKTLIFEFFLVVHCVRYNTGQFSWYNKVDDNLFLGAIPFVHPHMHTFPKALRVKAVLSINELFELQSHTLFGPLVSSSQWASQGVHHKQISSPDFFPPSFDVLEKGASYVNYHLSEGRAVYVHCKSGIGRSASVVVAYLMKYKRMGVHEAYAAVKMSRKEIFGPYSSQLKNLVKYESFLRSESNNCSGQVDTGESFRTR